MNDYPARTTKLALGTTGIGLLKVTATSIMPRQKFIPFFERAPAAVGVFRLQTLCAVGVLLTSLDPQQRHLGNT